MAGLRSPRPSPTDRERDILTHMRRIYGKLGVDTRAGAVAVAKEQRLLP
ncbi:hypothetical protein GCM10010415_30660 [Streptomyces atrovirens]